MGTLWKLLVALAVAAWPASSPAKLRPDRPDRPTRVAMLDFGPRPEDRGQLGDIFAVHIRPAAWEQAAKLLEAERPDLIVVRINSSGGPNTPVPQFQELFQNRMKPLGRVVAWIDSACDSAALAALPIETYVFAPRGVIAWPCVWPSGPSRPASPELRADCERAARWGRRDPALAGTLLLREGLSVDPLPGGGVVWRADDGGRLVLNRRGECGGSITADQALRAGLAIGVASSEDELFAALGLVGVQRVGQAAAARVREDLIQMSAACDVLSRCRDEYLDTKIHAGTNPCGTVDSTPVLRIRLARVRALLDWRPELMDAGVVSPKWIDAETAWVGASEASARSAQDSRNQ